MECNPFDIMGLSENVTLEEARARFRKLATQLHPDRPGGNQEKFTEMCKAYKQIFNALKEERTHQIRENMTLEQYRAQRNAALPTETETQSRITSSNFNRIFDECKIKDSYSRGYEQFMKSDQSKESAKTIALIDKQQSFASVCTGPGCALGEGHVTDFSNYVDKSKNSRDVACTDLKQAYSKKESLATMGNTRKDSYLGSSADRKKYESLRQKCTQPLTTEEKQRYDAWEMQEKTEETKRRIRAARQAEIAQRQWQRAIRF